MTVLDLADVPALALPPLPGALRGAVVATRYAVTCPYCEGPVGGLLAGCSEPECRTAELAADRCFERLADI